MGRNSWAVGRLGAGATLCLWPWGKVGCGQPQNSEVMWGPEQTLGLSILSLAQSRGPPSGPAAKISSASPRCIPCLCYQQLFKEMEGPESQFKKTHQIQRGPL